MTGPDLRPVNEKVLEKVLVYVEDPRGTKMAKWKNHKPSCCGKSSSPMPFFSGNTNK